MYPSIIKFLGFIRPEMFENVIKSSYSLFENFHAIGGVEIRNLYAMKSNKTVFNMLINSNKDDNIEIN